MLWRLVWSYLKPHTRPLIGVFVFQLVQVAAMLLLPVLNADIIDNGVAEGDIAHIWQVGLLMLLITFVQIVAAAIAVYFGARVAMALGRDIRRDIFNRVGEFSEREVALFGAPSLITRTTNDVQQVQMLVLMSLTMLVSAPILSIGGIVMAMQLDLALSGIVAVSVPLLLIAVSLIVSRMVPLFRAMQGRIDEVNKVLREQLTGIRVIRAFVREPEESARFELVNDAVAEASLRAGRLMALMFPVVLLVLNASSVAVIWFGAFRIEDGSMQVGTLIAFLSYLMQILMSVMMATFVVMMIPRAAVSGDRIGEVLNTHTSVRLHNSTVTTTRENGEIELEEVGFSYPNAEEPVLSGVSLRVHPGQTVAFIGGTGSGKSTLLNLVPRLFDATEGVVRFEGVDVRDLDPSVLWAQIGLVPQKAFLFSGTVRSNLLFGKRDATDDQMWTALETAQAAEFVRKLEGGLDAEVAQGGVNFSGGQRQRLAIARALIKQPRVFVFDDSFSALDLATESRLRQALRAQTAQATVLMVAQRVSTIIDADQIFVIDDGRIVAHGTHDELRATSQTYQEIVSSQLAAEARA